MFNKLLDAIEASDVKGASRLFDDEIKKGAKPWDIHVSIYPVVQRVLNPPFINPHLPKVYGICREFLPYLNESDLHALVRLEILEYARRPKFDKVFKSNIPTHAVSFKDIESAIHAQDQEKTAHMLTAFHEQKGPEEFARRLLILGSGYLDQSLGHSVSCTAFILLEMMSRSVPDPWPALSTLADYFCKGRFDSTPGLQNQTSTASKYDSDKELLRATSGRGIVNLHHTLTLYAIERARRFFSQKEYNHMIGMWIAFMGVKSIEKKTLDSDTKSPGIDYDHFFETFSKGDVGSVVDSILGITDSPKGRIQVGRYLILGICDQYQGDYDPHFLTGLGSALWIIEEYWQKPIIVQNALLQYLNYFFGGIRT